MPSPSTVPPMPPVTYSFYRRYCARAARAAIGEGPDRRSVGHVRQTGVEVAGAARHGLRLRLVRWPSCSPGGRRTGWGPCWFVVGVGVALLRSVRLEYRRCNYCRPSLGHEIFGQIKVPLFAGDLVQPSPKPSRQSRDQGNHAAGPALRPKRPST